MAVPMSIKSKLKFDEPCGKMKSLLASPDEAIHEVEKFMYEVLGTCQFHLIG
jgi:hypothetical protein